MPNDSMGPGSSKKPAAPRAAKPASSTGSPKKSSAAKRTPVKLDSPRWLAPLMIAFFVIGLAWIVAYYVAPDAPGIKTLGWWNVVIGFAFLAMGFFTSTRWR